MSSAIEQIWPVSLQGAAVPYAALRERMAEALRASGVNPLAFSHVGLVVDDVRQALRLLAEKVSPEWSAVEPRWGEAFGCHIARREEDGCEYEIIEPVRESFLKVHLDTMGAGVQHLSFQVADIHSGLGMLTGHGAAMADPDVHRGLHGLVAFVRPEGFDGLCLELCEVTS
jgi:hypothetical protein